MVRSDALKYFQKPAAAQVSQCCWLAYNLIIMTINVAGSWNFHLDIIAASAGAGPNNAQPGLQLGHYRQHCTCGDTRPVPSGDSVATKKLATLLVEVTNFCTKFSTKT